MRDGRKKVGRTGETICCEYLTQMGQTVLERNWRSSHLEVDIVSLDSSGGLHFVEVKSRVAPVSADPLVGITRSKRQSMVSAARHYLHEHSCGDVEIFLDVMTVILDGEHAQIEYYPNAVIPIYT